MIRIHFIPLYTTDRAEWKCHMAFLVPIDCTCWSLTAIDKCKEYGEKFKEFAISIPRAVDTSTRSTAVILWGLMRDENDANDRTVWRNINLQMIFQGYARSIVHIEDLNSGFLMPRPNEIQSFEQQKQDDGANCKRLRKTPNRWLPPLPNRFKEFTGTKIVNSPYSFFFK